MAGFELFRGDVLDAYRTWPAPATIISDGAYGVRGFHGDTVGSVDLPHWYRPHIQSWSAAAGPASTLWFWNTEIGWASVHPVLAEHGWDYVQLIVWDKGLGHIAGNVNGRTIRQFPVVTEVCALYQRTFSVTGPDGPMPVKQWIRHEWTRSGLALQRANEACGVKNAATRKYLTRDWLWYWPPGEMTERLAAYANAHGRPSGWPYYSLDGQRPVTAGEWDALRYRWRHAHGVTNVWSRRPLHDEERLKGTLRRAAPRVHNPTAASSAHLNQKPLEFMARLITAVTEPGDVVWEPFGGLCSGSVAAAALGRRAFAAEIDQRFADLAEQRLHGPAGNALRLVSQLLPRRPRRPRRPRPLCPRQPQPRWPAAARARASWPRCLAAARPLRAPGGAGTRSGRSCCAARHWPTGRERRGPRDQAAAGRPCAQPLRTSRPAVTGKANQC
jgi:DNA methylase